MNTIKHWIALKRYELAVRRANLTFKIRWWTTWFKSGNTLREHHRLGITIMDDVQKEVIKQMTRNLFTVVK